MDSPSQNNSAQTSLTRREIFEIIKGVIFEDNNALLALIEEHVSVVNGQAFTLCDDVKVVLRKLFHNLRTKFKDCHKIYQRFLAANESWLEIDVHLNDKPQNISEKPSTSAGVAGRPSSSFEDSNESTKRRRTQSLQDEYSIDELAYALQMSLRKSGNVDAAKVVKEIAEGGPSTSRKYINKVNAVCEKMITGDEALSLVVESKLSKNMYNNIRDTSLEYDCTLYPSYKYISEAKQECYPCSLSMKITECSAEVKLQALLDHTVQRILKVQKDVILTLTNDVIELNLICKWGCDETSGQSNIKQKFDDAECNKTGPNIFFVSLVPLQMLSVEKSTNKEIVVWKNSCSSSPRYCRPIKIDFFHETAETTKQLIDDIMEQQRNLTPFETIVNGKEINVKYTLSLTMIDGKVCNSQSIGQMSEEVQESCEKFIKQYWQDCRKCSRVKNMENIFKRLLVSSDPLISSLRELLANYQCSDDESAKSSDDEY